ncbi:hypothetical protein CC86DRAFT_144289 [Ophiobolus disseminans]|uniref:Uncharacterized protein n=1 Tax=Ophiobolus disseminans TaxID=1469910 RepID=A0A6A6ZEZ9_9PLEO|nr:hypothetical protein CC86DRAFT_144289 [Ophiobolus disseminans]
MPCTHTKQATYSGPIWFLAYDMRQMKKCHAPVMHAMQACLLVLRQTVVGSLAKTSGGRLPDLSRTAREIASYGTVVCLPSISDTFLRMPSLRAVAQWTAFPSLCLQCIRYSLGVRHVDELSKIRQDLHSSFVRRMWVLSSETTREAHTLRIFLGLLNSTKVVTICGRGFRMNEARGVKLKK